MMRDGKNRGTYVEGGDGAGGVAGDELDLHVESAVEVLVLGFEAGARGLVQGESYELAVVQNLDSAISERDVKILVEVTGQNNHG